MRKHELYTDYHDHFEYFGNTEIERIRKQGEKTISALSFGWHRAVAINLFFLHSSMGMPVVF